jgi:hypothetical protein
MKITLQILLLLCLLNTIGKAATRCENVPENGLQPEVAVSKDGTVHLVYLHGDPKAADIRYTWRKPDQVWQPSLTVNSLPGSAIAIGTIRGPQLALGKNGTVHVLWNGAATSASTPAQAPLWYARRLAQAGDFSKQEELRGITMALDGGASLTASEDGRVSVAWHGREDEAAAGEKNRLIFLRSSTDDGASFAKHEVINRSAPGICACCSLRVLLGDKGEPTIFVRNASATDHRAMTLYARVGEQWNSREIESWTIPTCPMSSAALAMSDHKMLGAWETAGRIRAGWISEPSLSPVTLAPKGAKHPAVAVNAQGKVLIVWVEGTGWNRGGTAAWQECDAQLKPTGPQGHAASVPVWGKVTVYAEPKGDFVILR